MSPILGDLDGDGDVDLRDIAEFQNRFTAEQEWASPGCQRADLDGDADVDGSDFTTLRGRFSGPQ